MSKKIEEELTPEQERMILRVRRLMLIPLAVMVAGFLTVFGVIAYRLYFKAPAGPAPPPPLETVLNLPQGARLVSTAVSDSKLVVTVETGGTTEVLLYDIDSMQPVGRFVIKTP